MMTYNAQLKLDLVLKKRPPKKEDLIIGDFNYKSYKFLFHKLPTLKKDNIVIIYGDSGVGKSYLAQLYLTTHGGQIIQFCDIDSLSKIDKLIDLNQTFLLEDIDIINNKQEKMLFSFYNALQLSNSKAILTSKVSVANLSIQLLDLKSRLQNSMILKIDQPDQDNLKLLTYKMFTDKQLSIDIKALNYLLNRVTRSTEAISRIVNKISQHNELHKSRISVKELHKILE